MLEQNFLWGITYKEFGIIIGGGLTLFTFYMTFKEFKGNNKTKRAEFLEKLTEEFNDPKMFLAKRILDDFWIEVEGSQQLTDVDLIRLGSEKGIKKIDLTEKVKHLLRHHETVSVTGFGEQKTRQSFDDLLDFFTKLEYYINLKLNSEKELDYFGYYLNKSANKADGAILAYAKKYEFNSAIKLIERFKVIVPDKGR